MIRQGAGPFKTVTLLSRITRFFNIGYIGEVCSNISLTIFVPRATYDFLRSAYAGLFDVHYLQRQRHKYMAPF